VLEEKIYVQEFYVNQEGDTTQRLNSKIEEREGKTGLDAKNSLHVLQQGWTSKG